MAEGERFLCVRLSGFRKCCSDEKEKLFGTILGEKATKVLCSLLAQIAIMAALIRLLYSMLSFQLNKDIRYHEMMK